MPSVAPTGAVPSPALPLAVWVAVQEGSVLERFCSLGTCIPEELLVGFLTYSPLIEQLGW